MQEKKDLIHRRIKSIKDPIQKTLLRDVLEDVVKEIFTYSDARFLEFGRKLDEELEDGSEKYHVYTAVCKQKDVDRTSRFLFEVCPNTFEESKILGRVFLECDYTVIKRYLNETFEAIVTTKNNTYKIEVGLQYSEEYLSRMAWLYRQFRANGRAWRSIHCPYAYRFFDIVDKGQSLPIEEEVISCELVIPDLSPQMIHTDMVLLWNVEVLEEEAEEVKVPGIDAILYEYSIKLPAGRNGYLAESGRLSDFYCIRNENSFVIRTGQKVYTAFKLLRFANRETDKDSTNLFMPLEGNMRILRHTDRQAGRQQIPVMTQGEIIRILNQYEAYQGLKLQCVSIINKADFHGTDAHSVSVNPFLASDLFLPKGNVLLLRFEQTDKEKGFPYEVICFLASELQLYFGGYQCVAELAHGALKGE